MKSTWFVLQHVSWEGPGLIATEAKARGQEIQVIKVQEDTQLPTSDAVKGLIVMGGPMGVYEESEYPFLTKESRLIAEVVQLQRPVLGVCLGSQLLANALGGKVFPGPQSEIGFGAIELTTAGKQDPLFSGLASSVPVFHWHGDTFDLPIGATLLGSSELYPHQAFRFGRCVYGLQFHVEPSSSTWREWQEHLPEGLLSGQEQQRIQIEEAGKKMLANFFDIALR